MVHIRFPALLFGFFGFLFASAVAIDAKDDARPNILFCIADDASAHLGAYGCTWVKTPNIDRLAKQGIVFDNAYTPTAKCAPSRAAILTGRNPWQLEEGANHQSFFPANYKVFTEAMNDAGLHAGSLGKFWGPGTAKTADGKDRKWGLASASNGKAQPKGIGENFRSFLSARSKDQPFFFWYGSKDPHRPYKLDSGIAASKKVSDIERVPSFWPQTDLVRRDMLDYAIEVEAYDAQIGDLLKVLEESGEAKNTLVIVTSDHGMPFPRVKGHNYELSNRVPLIASWPEGIVKPGRRVADLVSLIELAPTFLMLSKIDPVSSGMAPITGAGFVDLLQNSPKHDRRIAILGRERNDVWARPGTESGLGYPVRGIRRESWLYLHNFEPDRWPCGNVELGLKDTDASPTKALIEDAGEKDSFWQFCFGKRPQEELFELNSDPDCIHNLAADPKHDETITSLRDTLFAELKRQNDPRILGKGDVFDNYPSAKKPTGKDTKE